MKNIPYNSLNIGLSWNFLWQINYSSNFKISLIVLGHWQNIEKFFTEVYYVMLLVQFPIKSSLSFETSWARNLF